MNEAVVDTSVAFKWLGTPGEDSADQAMDLLLAHRAGEVSIVAPASLPLELANGLRYSGVAQRDVLQIVGDFDLTHIELVELSSTRLRRATELAFEHEMSVYDAVFLAVAEERGCPLITADHRAFERLDTKVEIRLL